LRAPRESEAGVDVQHRVEEGSPAQQIVQVANEIQVDLIVLGTHGPRGLLKWFTSNVTDHLVRESPCSVLIVKDPPAEAVQESTPA
jgi:nucleotide-binding universal stress UspA family protein